MRLNMGFAQLSPITFGGVDLSFLYALYDYATKLDNVAPFSYLS